MRGQLKKSPIFEFIERLSEVTEFPRAGGRTVGAPRRCERFKEPATLAIFTLDFFFLSAKRTQMYWHEKESFPQFFQSPDCTLNFPYTDLGMYTCT